MCREWADAPSVRTLPTRQQDLFTWSSSHDNTGIWFSQNSPYKDSFTQLLASNPFRDFYLGDGVWESGRFFDLDNVSLS